MKRTLLFFSFLFSIVITPSFSQNKVMCTPPNVSMSSNVTICNGQATTITAVASAGVTPYTFLWSPTTGLTNPNISNPSASPSATTTYTVLVTDAQPCTNTGTVTVFVNPTPTVSISSPASICTGSNATLTASGGTTYSWWNNGSTSATIIDAPTSQTTYTVTGTFSTTCSGTATATININNLPTITMGGTGSICIGSSATLTGNGGNTYSWSTTQIGNPIIVSPTSQTTYIVAGTNSVTGCTNIAAGIVNINSLPSISITSPASICPGTNATLTGNGGNTYSWNTGSTANPITVSPTSATTYTVWGTNTVTSCTNTATATVNLYPAASASVSGTNPICFGQNTTLTASGGTSYSWWNNGSTSAVIIDNPTSSTNYTVTATDGNTCTANATFSVTVNPLPTANAGTDVSICGGSPTILNATGNGTFLWSPSTGLSCTTCANPTVNITTTTTYTVTVTNSCGSKDDSVTVTINATPSVNAGLDATICNGGSTPLVASGSGTYLWSPATGLSCTTCANPTAFPTVSTNYTVTVTDVCGTASDSVWVIVDVPVATASGTSPICNGSSSTLCATGGGTYAWNTSATTSCITVSPTTSTGYTVTITDGFSCTATATTTVSVNALPTVAIAGTSTICAGINNTLTASGGTSYVWNTGASTTSIVVNPTTSTNYTVTATDGNGCSNTAMFSLTVNPQPTANAGNDATICFGNSTTLNGSGNGTYLWSPASTLINTSSPNPIADPTITTTYTVVVTNSCGSAVDSVVVNVNPLPTVAISGNSTICIGSTDTLSASGGVTYLWNTSATTSAINVSPTSATNYTVTATDGNGCSNTANFTVNVSSVTASITGTNAICSGQNSTLTASGGTTYVWNTGATTNPIIVSPTSTANYTVTASNSLGCTNTATFAVNVTTQPTASVTATTSTSLCAGSSTTLNACCGSTYLWTPTTGLTNSIISNPIANPTSSITYSVVVSNGACSDTASIFLTVNSNPTVTVTSSPVNICVGQCATISATGGSTYVWSPGGQTTNSISDCPTIATTYTVVATNANGCTAAGTSLINVLSPVNLLVNGNTNICEGSLSTLTAQNGGTTYLWMPGGQTTAVIVVSPSTTTTYTVSSSNGSCSDDTTITVNVFAAPTATATAASYTINIGSQTTLAGTTSTGTYNWSPSTGLSCAVCSNPVANPTETTTYTLCVTDANLCSACDTVIVYVDVKCDDLFVPNAFSPNNDQHNDVLCVRAPGSNGGGACMPSPCIKTIDFTIYNRWGQKVFHTEDISVGWDGTVNGKDADPAVFFYILNATLINDKFVNMQGNISLVK